MQKPFFKAGDRVRRKKEYQDIYWRNAQPPGLDPNRILTVHSLYHNWDGNMYLALDGVPMSWDADYFELAKKRKVV